MKKLALVLSLLILALALTGIAAASPPQEVSFTITATTTGYATQQLPGGRTEFELTAIGGSSGDIAGSFTFEESGIVARSGHGTNEGTLTITTTEGDVVIIKFQGQTDSVSVWGTFTAEDGTKRDAHLDGRGRYTGDAGLDFTVNFTGRFHNAP